MVSAIIDEANMNGAPDKKLPYPIDGERLSKHDCANEDQKKECSKFPYRRLVGQLMYGMVHTLVTIMYPLNVLTRYGAKPGPRHIAFLKHLSPRGLGAKVKVRERSVVSLGRAKKAKLDTKVGRLLLKRNLNV